MNKIIFIILIIGIVSGCQARVNIEYPHEVVGYGKYIPDEKKEELKDWSIAYMTKISDIKYYDIQSKMTNNFEQQALDLFGLPTIGILYTHDSESKTIFIPYDKCSESQKMKINSQR